MEGREEKYAERAWMEMEKHYCFAIGEVKRLGDGFEFADRGQRKCVKGWGRHSGWEEEMWYKQTGATDSIGDTGKRKGDEEVKTEER